MPLGQAVNAIVKEDDLQIDIAAQTVQQVVAAYRQAVAITSDDPDAEVGIGSFDSGSEGRSPTVDRVDAVSIHVIGETARAADPRNEYDILSRNPNFGQDFLHLGQDRIVAAAWAPAHLLIGDEILTG